MSSVIDCFAHRKLRESDLFRRVTKLRDCSTISHSPRGFVALVRDTAANKVPAREIPRATDWSWCSYKVTAPPSCCACVNKVVWPFSGSRNAYQETIQERAQDANTAVQSSSEADPREGTERKAQGTHQAVTRGEDEKDGGSLCTIRSEHFWNVAKTNGKEFTVCLWETLLVSKETVWLHRRTSKTLSNFINVKLIYCSKLVKVLFWALVLRHSSQK